MKNRTLQNVYEICSKILSIDQSLINVNVVEAGHTSTTSARYGYVFTTTETSVLLK